MALTVTTDLTVITTAETVTGWTAIGAQSPALEPDFFVQGSNCISRAVSGAAVVKGMVFDNGAGINFTTTHADKLVYIWMRVNTVQLADTRANAGVTVRLCTTSATADYREWNVDGKDSIAGPDGWICYVVDPRSAGTVTSGSYVATSVRFFGGTLKTTTTAKGQNLGIDQIAYGRGELRVSGTVATAGQGFKEIAAVAYDAAGTNRWGIMVEKAGVFYVRGKIILGHATSNTTFSSFGEVVVWESPGYYNGTNVVKLIPDASVGGTTGSDGKTTYNGLGIIGGSGTTTIDFGVIVGADAGRSGSSLSCALNSGLTTPARTLATVTVDNSTMGLSLYATTFAGFEGQIDLTGTGIAGDDCFGCTFNGCGRIDSNMEIRNVNVLNSVASTTDGAFIWSDTTNLEIGVFAGNSRAIVFEATTGTPFDFLDLSFSGNTFDVRNESLGSITVNSIGGNEPTVENSGGGSSTTIVVNPVTTSITVLNLDLDPIFEARVLILAANGTGPMPYLDSTAIERSGGTATATVVGHGLLDGDYAVIKGAVQPEYNGPFQVEVTGTDTFTYAVTGTPQTPATGTITTTGAPLYGLTDIDGFISTSRSYGTSQPIVGRIRKSTGTPLYKTSAVSGIISNTGGFSTTVQMIPDE